MGGPHLGLELRISKDIEENVAWQVVSAPHALPNLRQLRQDPIRPNEPPFVETPSPWPPFIPTTPVEEQGTMPNFGEVSLAAGSAARASDSLPESYCTHNAIRLQNWGRNSEINICTRAGIQEGKELKKYLGRLTEPRFANRPLAPLSNDRDGAQVGKDSQVWGRVVSHCTHRIKLIKRLATFHCPTPRPSPPPPSDAWLGGQLYSDECPFGPEYVWICDRDDANAQPPPQPAPAGKVTHQAEKDPVEEAYKPKGPAQNNSMSTLNALTAAQNLNVVLPREANKLALELGRTNKEKPLIVRREAEAVGKLLRDSATTVSSLEIIKITAKLNATSEAKAAAKEERDSLSVFIASTVAKGMREVHNMTKPPQTGQHGAA